jgi:hypothetical protein
MDEEKRERESMEENQRGEKGVEENGGERG